MSRIVFVMLEDFASHTSSALLLARQLRARQHEVVFMGRGLDVRRSVEREGFAYLTLPVNHLALALRLFRRSRAPRALAELTAAARRVLGDDYDLLICDRFNWVAALAMHRLGKKYILLQPIIPSADPQSTRFLLGASPEAAEVLQRYRKRNRYSLPLSRAATAVGKRLGFSTPDTLFRDAGIPGDLVAEDPYDFLNVPTIVTCPRAFDLPQAQPGHFFFANAVAPEREEPPFEWPAGADGCHVLYVSFGSFVSKKAFPRVFRWLHRQIGQFGAWEGWHVVIAMGSGYVPGTIRDVPANVTLGGFVPQLTVLKRASVMLTHGGINSVLECIFAGVPMIATPLFGDQFGNIGRVVHHGLGFAHDYRRESSAALQRKAAELVNDPRYRRNVELMREKCLRADADADPVAMIEAQLRA